MPSPLADKRGFNLAAGGGSRRPDSPLGDPHDDFPAQSLPKGPPKHRMDMLMIYSPGSVPIFGKLVLNIFYKSYIFTKFSSNPFAELWIVHPFITASIKKANLLKSRDLRLDKYCTCPE